MEEANIVVIGAGAVGLSVAASLSGREHEVVVLEKNKRTGQEISTHNSGVIHSGIHYPRGSLKAELCVRGNEMIYDMCGKYSISHRNTGKLTVAIGKDQIQQLEILHRNGTENGVAGLELLDSSEIRELEPEVRADAALHSPTSGIIEPDDLMNHYASNFDRNGGLIATETEVTGIRRSSSGYILTGISVGEPFEMHAHSVINCAGLFADRIAEMAGLDIDSAGYRQQYCKGDYFRVSGGPLVKMLVYPVPKGAGLGIHLTPDMSGSVRLGPNAYYVDQIDYRTQSDKNEFRNDVGRFIPSISGRTISEDSSGIRPKLRGPDNQFKDFVIRHEADRHLPGFINLVGIESPGLTASPAIGVYVSDLYEKEICGDVI